MKVFAFLIILAAVSFRCNDISNEKIIAQVYDQKLTEQDLLSELSRKQILNDSIAFTQSYINTWINKKVLEHHALKEGLVDQKLIDEKVSNYKNQLLIHYFQNQLITERLDTVVSRAEIKEYYLSHKPDFQLKDYIVKVLYIKVAIDAPEIENLSSWYRLRNEEDEEKLIQYAGLYASNFYYDKINWIYFDEITKEIPLSDINKDKFITKKGEIQFTENNYYYFLNILDYKLKNAVSPIEFEKNNIKERILNTRVLTLRENINAELLKKAENENAIKKF